MYTDNETDTETCLPMLYRKLGNISFQQTGADILTDTDTITDKNTEILTKQLDLTFILNSYKVLFTCFILMSSNYANFVIIWYQILR